MLVVWEKLRGEDMEMIILYSYRNILKEDTPRTVIIMTYAVKRRLFFHGKILE